MVYAIVPNRDTAIKTKNRSRFASKKAEYPGFLRTLEPGNSNKRIGKILMRL